MAGISFKFAAKTIINNIASQKSGIDKPRKAAKLTELSAIVFLRVAAMMPAGTAMATAMTAESSASDKVRGRASAIICETGTREP